MPLTRIEPLVGVSRSATARKSVVLPQPDGPMKETNSPRAILRSTLLKAATGPSAVSKRSETPLISIAASAAGALSPSFGLNLETAATSIADPTPSALNARHGGEFLIALERARVRGERLALDEAAAPELGLHRAVAEHDFAARERIARQPGHFGPFEDVVVDDRNLGPGRDGLVGLGIPDRDVGVGAGQDRPLARIEIENAGDVGRGHGDELIRREPPGLDA